MGTSVRFLLFLTFSWGIFALLLWVRLEVWRDVSCKGIQPSCEIYELWVMWVVSRETSSFLFLRDHCQVWNNAPISCFSILLSFLMKPANGTNCQLSESFQFEDIKISINGENGRIPSVSRGGIYYFKEILTFWIPCFVREFYWSFDIAMWETFIHGNSLCLQWEHSLFSENYSWIYFKRIHCEPTSIERPCH